MMTLELGRIRTWRLPAFSALLMELSASLRTDVRTMMAVGGDSQGALAARGICAEMGLAFKSHSSAKSAFMAESDEGSSARV